MANYRRLYRDISDELFDAEASLLFLMDNPDLVDEWRELTESTTAEIFRDIKRDMHEEVLGVPHGETAMFAEWTARIVLCHLHATHDATLSLATNAERPLTEVQRADLERRLDAYDLNGFVDEQREARRTVAEIVSDEQGRSEWRAMREECRRELLDSHRRRYR